MGRQARVELVSLKSSLVNLPISLYGPLLERQVRPQHLAVHLSRVTNGQSEGRGAVSAYVGWSGMASASSLARFAASSARSADTLETIELDPQFAQALRLAQGDIVEIGLLHNLTQAESVGAEPVSPDDWEIIDLHAAHIETTLLSQARVAAIGQEIALWVLGRTLVRLRIVSLTPTSKTNALLLGTDTELVIAPKTRGQPAKQKAPPASISTTTELATNSKSSKERAAQTNTRSAELRVVPVHALLLPVGDTTEKQRAYVSRRIFSLLTGCSLSDLFYDPEADVEQVAVHLCSVRLRRVPVPLSIAPTTEPKSAIPPAPRVLNPADPDAPAVVAPEAVMDDGEEVLLACVPALEVAPMLPDERAREWAGVPDGSVALVAREGKSGYAVGDRVRLYVDRGVTRSEERIAPLPELPLLPPDPSAPILAGVAPLITRLTDFTVHAFLAQSQPSGALCGAPALLLVGKAGAGKTAIVQAVSRALKFSPRAFAYTEFVDCAKLADKPVSTLKGLFATWRERAQWYRPTILVLDNLDRLLPAESENAPSGRPAQLAALFQGAFSPSKVSLPHDLRHIVIIATARDRTEVHPSILSSHLITEVANMGGLNKDARREILDAVMTQRTLTSPLIKDGSVNTTLLATRTEGYLPVDLRDLVSRAVHNAAIRAGDEPAALTAEDFEKALEGFVPRSLRDVPKQESDVHWADIGGLNDARRILRETLEWPTKYGPIFAQSPLRLRSGLLLYGYPGCGKTLLASAVARECGLNFVGVKGPEILNKYIGASEKSVRDLFERASAAKPCVLFFDEFDSIAPKRGHDSTGVTDRVVNQMLTQMDGAEGLEGVYVLAATSRPDLIDAALLRPGRLDKAILCDMPSMEDRVEIIRALARKVHLADDVDIEALARDTEGFSGADLQALVYNAHLEVVHDAISAGVEDSKGKGKGKAVDNDSLRKPAEEKPIEYVRLGGPKDRKTLSRAEETALQRRLKQIMSGSQSERNVASAVTRPPEKREVTDRHLHRVLQTTRPSVSTEDRERLRRIYAAFVGDRSGSLPVPVDGGGVGQRVSLM